MRFSKLVVAALSVPRCVDGTSTDDGDDHLSTTSMLDQAQMAMSSSLVDTGGLSPIGFEAREGKEPLTQETERRNPENAVDPASRVENDDDFSIDVGVLSMERKLSTECASYPVLNQTGELYFWNFQDLVFWCYSESPYAKNCPYEYRVGLHCWNTSLMTDLSNAFDGLEHFNDDVSSWDIGKVTSLFETFSGVGSFNSDISSWDTSNVTSLDSTFCYARSFNVDISSWDTGKVTSLRSTFSGADRFNVDISAWDIGKVTNLDFTFQDARSFNVDISAWNTGNVTTLWETFSCASSFNVDISTWDTGKVVDMDGTFKRATSFNVDISAWDTGKVRNMNSMFHGAATFSKCLCGWAANSPSTVRTKLMLNGTACPNQSDPDPEKGPWCQGFEERCFVACCDSINDIIAPTERKLKETLRRVCRKKPSEEATGRKIRGRDVSQEARGTRDFWRTKLPFIRV